MATTIFVAASSLRPAEWRRRVLKLASSFADTCTKCLNRIRSFRCWIATEMKFRTALPRIRPRILVQSRRGGSQCRWTRVTLCPHCHGIPTFRRGCSLCLSSNVKASKMIHHFACAHVDFVENFDRKMSFVVRSVELARLIIGSDYEYLDGPNMCYDCGQANWNKFKSAIVSAANIDSRSRSAYTMEIVGYRVNKLDVLGFINTA